MSMRNWTTVLALSCCLSVLTGGALSAKAAPGTVEKPRVIYLPARGVERGGEKELLAKAPVNNLVYHGGALIPVPKVVLIFWGPTFANAASPDHAYAVALQAYRNGFGNTPQWADIQQYGIAAPPVALGVGTPDWFDVRVPPVNVTDALVQAEVNAYLAFHPVDFTAVYQVVIPPGSFSSDAGVTSCGGPNLEYCTYHSWIGNDPTAIKYSIQPYPSCGGCQVPGWTPTQNQEHLLGHQIRQVVTDPTGLGWWDAGGEEADGKCAWAPPPYLVGGSGYQFEWSNAVAACVR